MIDDCIVDIYWLELNMFYHADAWLGDWFDDGDIAEIFHTRQATVDLTEPMHCVRNRHIHRSLDVSHAKVKIKQYDPGDNIDWNADAGGKWFNEGSSC
jgi:hypothetical protein